MTESYISPVDATWVNILFSPPVHRVFSYARTSIDTRLVLRTGPLLCVRLPPVPAHRRTAWIPLQDSIGHETHAFATTGVQIFQCSIPSQLNRQPKYCISTGFGWCDGVRKTGWRRACNINRTSELSRNYSRLRGSIRPTTTRRRERCYFTREARQVCGRGRDARLHYRRLV